MQTEELDAQPHQGWLLFTTCLALDGVSIQAKLAA